MEATRRTQAERAAGTREALTAAVRQLFAAHGFADVALETIVRAAGVTRGACTTTSPTRPSCLPRFSSRSKGSWPRGWARQSSRPIRPIRSRSCGSASTFGWMPPPIRKCSASCLSTPRPCWGWARWTEIGNRYNIGFVRDLLAGAIEIGRIPPQPVEATALTMLGAMREATLYVARAEDHDHARQEAGAVMNRLMQALSAG